MADVLFAGSAILSRERDSANAKFSGRGRAPWELATLWIEIMLAAFGIETLVKATLAAAETGGWEWMFTGFLQWVVGLWSISLLFVILTFVLRDPWLLLSVPAAFFGTAAGAPGHTTYTRCVSLFFVIVAVLGFFVGLSSEQGWRSPVFLISCGLLVSFAETLTYHAICRRAFLRLLLTRKEFYEAVLNADVIKVRAQH